MSAETAPDYPYAQGSLLDQRNNYFYTAYRGREFLHAWRKARLTAWSELRSGIPTAGSPLTVPGEPATATFLSEIRAALQQSVRLSTPQQQALDALLKRFEVSKRIHGAYDTQWRPLEAADYRDLRLYVSWGQTLEQAWARTGRLPYLNALLKCLDILLAYRTQLTPSLQASVAELIGREQTHVTALAAAARVNGPC